MSNRVVVFDVDGTLLRGDCLLMAALHAPSPVAQVLASVACSPQLIGWQLGLISTGQLKQKVIAAFGICEAVNHAAAVGQDPWLLNQLKSQIRPKALMRLRQHQHRGDRVLLCSASPRLLLQPLADWLGVELLCTELEQSDMEWRPKLSSPNCKGPEKVRRLAEHLGPLDGLTIEAYGDSKGDRELLKSADIPHYRSFLAEPRAYPAFSLGPLLPVLAIAVLGYGLLGIWSQGEQLFPLLRRLWPQIGLGILLVMLGYAIRYGRWRLLLAAVNQYPPLKADARIWMGSYAFTATPGKSGEALRSLLLKQEFGVPMPPTLMALVVERLTDGAAVLLLLLINLPLLLLWQVPLIVPTSLLLAVVIGGLVLMRSRWAMASIKGTAKRLLPLQLASAGSDGLISLRQLLQPWLLLQATLFGAFAWSAEGISLWMLLRGMGVSEVGIGGATIAHVAAGMIGAFTLLPGGLGSTEASTIGLLALQGVGVTAATPATLLIRLMTLWFATALGVI